jgi:Telomeric single stranded DNA binding POT1/CDC13
LYGPPIPTAETTVSSLPHVPTPPIPTQGSPSSQQEVWRTPLKRKFAELTDHSITSSLTDEEEWFGSEPKGGSSGHRRFSGRMRFIGLNDSTTPSIPTSRRESSDENSFAMARRTQVSPALVLHAQNLVSQAILSEKLLHPPRSVGTGVDEMSHAAVQEGSVRRMSAGAVSTSGRRSIGERSFEVFHDEDDEEDVTDTSATNILPKELTQPTDVEHWNVPVRPVAEKRPPSTRPQPQQSAAEQLFTDETPHSQITESPSPSAQSEEASNEGLDTFDTGDQLIQPTRRRYYYPESRESSAERPSESDRIDYGYPETYADDEELSGEDYEEEEDLHHAGYYAQDQKARIDEEGYYHSDEEEQEEESEGEEEEERPSQEKGPLVVDLTLDSSEEESEEEEALEDQIVVQRPSRRYEDADEVMVRSEDEEDEEKEEEEEEEEYEDDETGASSWAGIGSATPFTDISRPSQHQSPRVEQALDFLLDPTLMTPLPDEINQPVPFNYESAVPSQPPSMVQPDVQSFPQDLFAQGLDPAMFQDQQSSFQPVMNELDPNTVSLLDSVLSFQTDQSTLLTTQQTSFQSTIPDIPQFTPVSSAIPPRMEDAKGVDVVDRAAAEEFLLGLMPMGDLERHNEDNFENQRQREESQEFLPNIVPDTPTVLKPPPSPEKRIQTEPTIVPDTTQVDQQQTGLDKSPPPNLQSQETQPVLQHILRSPSPPPLPDNWATEGLTTQLAYYPPLAEIRPPSLRLQKENRTVDLIGIIRESSEIKKTKGPDYILSLAIVDPSTGSETGLSILLFRPYKSALPSNPTTGSAIILTNMKVVSFREM